MQTTTRRRWCLLLAVTALAMLAFAGAAAASGPQPFVQFLAEPPAPPTIVSDRLDYAPGDTVLLSGAGWQGDTSVRVVVNDVLGYPWIDAASVAVDGDGAISLSFSLPLYFSAIYEVTATGAQTGRTATTVFSDAPQKVTISNDFSQASNGNPFTGSSEWIYGILNAEKTTYKEGMSSPQRLVIWDGPAASAADANGYRSFVFSLAFYQGSNYAYDFPTGSSTLNPGIWGQARADAAFKGLAWTDLDPLGQLKPGTDAYNAASYLLASGTRDQAAFPDTFTGAPTDFAGIVAAYEGAYGDRMLDIYHDGDMTDISFDAAYLDKELVYYTVKYRVPDGGTAPNRVFFAWGGHIAVGYDGKALADDWGLGMGAGAINGGPYHVRTESWDPGGNLGAQDNQIMAAAVIAPGVKSGHKYDDLGSPLSGWTIKAYSGTSGSTVATSTTTGADGSYEFILDPGDYRVGEDLQTDWYQTLPNGSSTPPSGETIVTMPNGTYGYAFTMGEAEEYAANDFENRQVVNQGAIVVKKYHDVDGGGSQSNATDEPWLEGWEFRLFKENGLQSGLQLSGGDADTLIDTLSTDVNGEALFTTLLAGTYYAVETLQAGWVNTDPGPTSATDPYETIVLPLNGAGQAIFGNFETGTKSGHKYVDPNGDGDLSDKVAYTEGWDIYLYEDVNGDGALDLPGDILAATVTTDAAGAYEFGELLAGDYIVAEASKTGWVQTYPASGIYAFTVTSGFSETTNDFGNFKSGVKGGHKYVDPNGDGNLSDKVAYTDGWTIRLYNDVNGDGALDLPGDTLAATAITDATGAYSFSGLAAGKYIVAEDTSDAAWVQTYPASGIYAFTVTSGFNDTDNDFGNFELGTKSGHKYVDPNGDGDLSDKVAYTEGWDIYLYEDVSPYGTLESEPVFKTATTDAAGAYEFDGLAAGKYLVAEASKTGWVQTFPAAPGIYAFTVTSGFSETTNDFGNFQLGTKSGHKYVDPNGDGDLSDKVAYTEGWTINLYKDVEPFGTLESEAVFKTATTDATGAYEFDGLAAGRYIVAEASKTGWVQTFPAAPGIYAFTVTSGFSETDNDFGNFKSGVKGGHKYVDPNGDGDLSDKVAYTTGWDIYLYKDVSPFGSLEEEPVFKTATTDATGAYSFTGLAAGHYIVAEASKTGWVQTYPASGFYAFTVTSGFNDLDNDFGNFKSGVKGGHKYIDPNGDGDLSDKVAYTEGWTINLYKDVDPIGTLESEPVFKTATTDATGAYSFTGLAAGDYLVAEASKTGWVQTYPAAPGIHAFTVTSGFNDTDNDFGNFKYGVKSGHKYVDPNGDGNLSDKVAYTAGWTIRLYNDVNGNGTLDLPGDTVAQTVTTDAAGKYEFAGLVAGKYIVAEASKTGWAQSYPAAPGYYAFTVTSGFKETGNDFGNYELSKAQVVKLTKGIPIDDPNTPGFMTWTFGIFNGPHDGDPSGWLGSPLAQDTTPPSLLDFGGLWLSPLNAYTLAEYNVWAGWTSLWWIDNAPYLDTDPGTGKVVPGTGDVVVSPYNPNAFDSVPQDVGNRAIDFGDGQTVALPFGGTLHLVVDNSFPGGEARTPGYWKNWNSESGGGQMRTAAAAGGPAAGVYTLDDLLKAGSFAIGLLSLDGIWDNDDFRYENANGDVREAVRILNKSDARTGKKLASDAAYELACFLLATRLNYAAGAYTTPQVDQAILAAQALLVKISFTGTGSYLPSNTKKVADRALALGLAKTLDQYCNNLL